MQPVATGQVSTYPPNRREEWAKLVYLFAARRAPVALGVALALTGCSSLSPQIFSDRLMTDGNTSGPPETLKEAYDDAAEVQRRYFTAVRNQGNATPQLSLGLIGLSAIALFKGMTHPNTSDMVGMGVAGSAAYAAGNTLLSSPRLDVYRAGGEALGCAMTAVEPLRIGADPAILGKLTDTASERTLYGRSVQLVDARDELQDQLQKVQDLATIRHVPDTGKRKVKVRLPPECKALPANPTPIEKLQDQQCKAKPGVLTTREEPAPAGALIDEAPPDELDRVVIEARALIEATDRQIDAAQSDINTLVSAGPALWSRSLAIQKVVSEEVGKTVPNLAAVMAAAKGMKSTGFSVPGADAPKAEGVAQNAQTRRRAVTDADKNAIDKLSKAIQDLKRARRDMAALLRVALGAGHEDVRARLNECSVKISGVALTVTPGGEKVQAALDGTAVFFVSGGRGIPSGAVVEPNPKHATLTFKPEGGLARFEFKPPSTAAAGDVYRLRFTDADGVVEQIVSVEVVAAAKATTSIPQDDVNKAPTPESPDAEDKAAKPKVLGAVRDRGIVSVGYLTLN